jgi:hypothetical protein
MDIFVETYSRMKNLFEPDVYQEIKSRVDKLNSQTPSLWGKMDVAQMMAHCTAAFEVGLGDRNLKRGMLGMLFGGLVKRQYVYSTKFKRNQPTDPTFVVRDQRNFDREKERLLNMIDRLHQGGEQVITKAPHPFFGKMSAMEWAQLSYNHMNHHLNQFGV